ncbi:MAG: DMT family transporter [Clostridiales bacterium]
MKNLADKERLGPLMAFISAASFGAYPIFAKLAYGFGVNVPTVLFLRFSGCVILLWVFLIFTKRYQAFPKEAVIKLLLVGALVYSAMSALNLLAVTMISASLASLLLCTYPIFVTIVTIIRKDDRLTKDKAGALVLSFIGIALLLNVDLSQINAWGILCGIGASFAYTAYVVIGNVIQKDLEPIQSATLIMSGACITYTLNGLIAGSLFFGFPGCGWLAMAGMILCSTVFAVVLFWASIKTIGPAKASIIGTAEPLVSVILAVILFDEKMTLLQCLGSGLIIAGVLIIQRVKSKSEPAMTRA